LSCMGAGPDTDLVVGGDLGVGTRLDLGDEVGTHHMPDAVDRDASTEGQGQRHAWRSPVRVIKDKEYPRPCKTARNVACSTAPASGSLRPSRYSVINMRCGLVRPRQRSGCCTCCVRATARRKAFVD